MNYTTTGQPRGAQLPTATEVLSTVAEAHRYCTECSACGAGWDRKIRREVPYVHPQAEDGTIRPATLVGLLFALVPITLLLTFSARLAGMLAGTVGGVA